MALKISKLKKEQKDLLFYREEVLFNSSILFFCLIKAILAVTIIKVCAFIAYIAVATGTLCHQIFIRRITTYHTLYFARHMFYLLFTNFLYILSN